MILLLRRILCFLYMRKLTILNCNKKNTINSRLSFPIAILTLILGASTFLKRDLPKTDGSISYLIFFVAFIAAIVCLVFALYFFARSIFPYKYAYVKSIGTIDSIIRALKKYNFPPPQLSCPLQPNRYVLKCCIRRRVYLISQLVS